MKGYTKGVNFHTSANQHFGGKTKPTSVQVQPHARAMPVRRAIASEIRGAVGAYAQGGPVRAAAVAKSPATPPQETKAQFKAAAMKRQDPPAPKQRLSRAADRQDYADKSGGDEQRETARIGNTKASYKAAKDAQAQKLIQGLKK